ncbi:MAG: dimethylarginine dimethylaminohydrolase family protein [Gemmatimonadaceae bacterium]
MFEIYAQNRKEARPAALETFDLVVPVFRRCKERVARCGIGAGSDQARKADNLVETIVEGVPNGDVALPSQHGGANADLRHLRAVLIAITRPLSPSFADGERTHIERQRIDLTAANLEHGAYEDALRGLGACVVHAPHAPDQPDAVFVEDTAIVLDEVAVITRPGAPSRRPETIGIAQVLANYRPLIHLEAPATLDGGDVLRLGRVLYVGCSTRTNTEAIAQLQALLKPWQYRVVPVDVLGCLHLKSAVTAVGDNRLLINGAWTNARAFEGNELIDVAAEEPFGANALLVRDSVIHASHLPRTAERLERAGIRVIRTACSEIAKGEGAVTCCSLVFEY